MRPTTSMPPPPSRTSSSSASAAPPSFVGLNGDDDDDQRFAELLRPIKDLTQNWEVPLAKYLESYIDEVRGGRESRINLHGRGCVNFAEAALFLQGTASVYSKKVEFLWQNVLEMLDLLASRKALDDADDNENEPGNKKRKQRTGGLHDLHDFTHITTELSRSINLKTDDVAGTTDKVKDRKLALNFITVTPRQLIEKEDKDQKTLRINIYAKGSAANDLIGHKEDFRVNAQFLMATACVGEELCSEQELGEHSVSLCDEENSAMFMQTSLLNPHHVSPGKDREEQQPQDAEEVPEEDAPAALDDYDDNDGVASEAAAPSAASTDDNNSIAAPSSSEPPTEEENDIRKSKRRGDKFQEILDEPKAPLTDRWEPVKPHEGDNVVVRQRPIKKGKTCKAPPYIELSKHRTQAGSRSREKCQRGKETTGIVCKKVVVSTPIEQHLIHDNMYASLGRTKGVPEDFLESAYQEGKERKKTRESKNQSKGAGQEEEAAEQQQAAAEANDDGWEDFQGGAYGDNYVGDAAGVAAFDDDDDPLPDPHAHDLQVLGGMLAPESDETASTEADDKNGDTYEELVIKRVAAYVQQSQEYIESTDLAKKVSDWHQHIAPKLDRVERRAQFDIHQYGSNILSHFPGGGDEEEAAAKSRKSTTTFKQVVNGRDRDEVCRYFLSSLMLANTYNLDLQPREEEETTVRVQTQTAVLPMDDINLVLLSRKRHHVGLFDNDQK